MTKLDHDRVTNIFAEAMELPVSRRGAFLDSTCAGEPDLRCELDELLGCADGASAEFDAAAQLIIAPDPDRIGPYELLEPIGEGGMAVVYKAQQHHPVKRIVAIKLIKLGMDTRQFVARFESERQALAMMDHPNVARVFDAGSTESGRPYFVMEHVPGEPILAWCDARRLGLRARLALFVPACEAVEHAHRKGIIHRDLKSSNVLITDVDGRALPKVIDFGVAKVVSEQLGDRTTFTEQGQLIGTPEYMSPEQAERGALDVDTRSDVYSLGVLLYELIAGVQPIPSDVWRSGSFEQVQRLIRQTGLARPSTRLGTLARDDATAVAQRRSMPVQTLIRELRSELEWIPLKAMRKDREQRYRSAVELADDIRNYLDGRPLIAGPESTRYRLGKFLHRHKAGVVAAAIMAFLLIAGIITTTWQAVRANREKREAQFQRHQAVVASDNLREVNRFLVEDLLHSAAPEVTRGKDLTVREAVDRAADSVRERFTGRPSTEAAIHVVLADTYDSLGLFEHSLAHAQSGKALYLRTTGADHETTLNATRIVARQLYKLNRHSEAEPLLRDALARCEKSLPPGHETTINTRSDLASTLRRQRRYAEAEPLYRADLEATRERFGSGSDELASSMNGLAVLLADAGRDDEAEPLYRAALEIRRMHGTDHPNYLTSLANLARLLERRGRVDEAEAMFREALATRRRVLKDDHPSTLLAMNDLGTCLGVQEKYDEAEALHRETLSRRLRISGPDNPETLISMTNLGRVLDLRGQHAAGEELIRQALESRRRVLGATHPHTLTSTIMLVRTCAMQGEWDEAEALLAELTRPEIFQKLPPQQQASVLARLGTRLVEKRQFAEAEPILLDARRRLIEMKTNVSQREVLGALVQLFADTHRPQEADKYRSELAALPATLPTSRPAK